jgi:hypothetical protein
VQHYVAEVAEPTYCGMNSISDVITANAGTQVNVVRELSAEKVDDGRDPLHEQVMAHPMDAFMRFSKTMGPPTKTPRQPVRSAGRDDNRRETPPFAASIARRGAVGNAVNDFAASESRKANMPSSARFRSCVP